MCQHHLTAAGRYIPLKQVLWARNEVDSSGVAPVETEEQLAVESGILGNRNKHTIEAVGCVTWQGRKKRKGDAPDVAVGGYEGIRPAIAKKKRAARKKKTVMESVETAVVDAVGIVDDDMQKLSVCMSDCLSGLLCLSICLS